MISVTFTSDVENIVATEHLYQWDNGQKLSISGVGTTADIHFANKKSEKALVVTPTITSGAMVAFIPNSLLAESYPIIAYVYVPSDDGSKTIKSVTINVEARKQPSDFVLTEDEGVTTLEAISQRANEMIQNATNQVNTAIANMQTDYTNFKNTIHGELADMVANTTIPNADTVDGKHASDFVQKSGDSMSGNLRMENNQLWFGVGGITQFRFENTNGVLNLKNHDGTTIFTADYGGSYATNADTLDGKHAADFVSFSGLITDVALLNNAAYEHSYEGTVPDTYTPDIGLPIANEASKSGWWWHIKYFHNAGGEYGCQLAFPVNAPFLLPRYRTSLRTTWNPWKNIADGGNADTANTAGTLATTASNVCLRNISFGTAEPQVTDPSAEGYVAEGALYGQYV